MQEGSQHHRQVVLVHQHLLGNAGIHPLAGSLWVLLLLSSCHCPLNHAQPLLRKCSNINSTWWRKKTSKHRGSTEAGMCSGGMTLLDVSLISLSNTGRPRAGQSPSRWPNSTGAMLLPPMTVSVLSRHLPATPKLECGTNTRSSKGGVL